MVYDYILDTDVLIWYLRGNKNSYNLIHSLDKFCISSSYFIWKLVQGMRNKDELRALQKTLKQWGVKTIYIDEEISSRALFYMERVFFKS